MCLKPIGYTSSKRQCRSIRRLDLKGDREGIYDKYAEALAAKVKELKIGPGFDDGV